MCLGIPAKVIQIEELKIGKIDYPGTNDFRNSSPNLLTYEKLLPAYRIILET